MLVYFIRATPKVLTKLNNTRVMFYIADFYSLRTFVLLQLSWVQLLLECHGVPKNTRFRALRQWQSLYAMPGPTKPVFYFHFNPYSK